MDICFPLTTDVLALPEAVISFEARLLSLYELRGCPPGDCLSHSDPAALGQGVGQNHTKMMREDCAQYPSKGVASSTRRGSPIRTQYIARADEHRFCMATAIFCCGKRRVRAAYLGRARPKPCLDNRRHPYSASFAERGGAAKGSRPRDCFSCAA